MAKWHITFEMELPDASIQDAQDWASYALGRTSSLALANPCSHVSLPNSTVDWVSVSRVYGFVGGKS